MADLSGIRAAIATNQAAAAGIRESTSTKLSAPTVLPCVKVDRISTVEIYDARGGRGGGFESRMLTVEGVLIVPRAADVGRAQVDAETYVEALFAAARTGLKLGYATIVEDYWLDRAEIGEVEYAEQEWFGANLTWMVKLHETGITRTS